MEKNKLAPKKLTFKEIGQDFVGKFLKIVRKESIESPLDGPEDELFFVQKIDEDEKVFGWKIEEIQENPAKMLMESTDWRKVLSNSSYYFTPPNDAERELITKSLKNISTKINKIINHL